MSEPKHTPGPWKCDNDGTVYSYSAGTFVCDVAYDEQTAKKFKADCDLIAAAPELLAFAKSMADDPGVTEPIEDQTITAKAREVVAKAEGADNDSQTS